jgi:hypothetical protein
MAPNFYKNAKWLLATSVLLALLISCADFPEIPYSERLEVSSSGSLASSSSELFISSSSGSKTENSFTDERNDITYSYVEIGGYVWMAQNLNYAASGSTCYNHKANCNEYGRLYSFEAAKKACPTNWHLPSNAEWSKLLAVASGSLVADFAVLYGGYGNGEDDFTLEGITGSWWSLEGYYYSITANYDDVQSKIDLPDALNSVRCVRDDK